MTCQIARTTAPINRIFPRASVVLQSSLWQSKTSNLFGIVKVFESQLNVLSQNLQNWMQRHFLRFCTCGVFLEGTCSCSSDETQQISAAYRFNTSCHRQRVPSGEQWLLRGFPWSNPAVNHVSPLHRLAPCDLNILNSSRCQSTRISWTGFSMSMSLECRVYDFLHTFVRCTVSIPHGICLEFVWIILDIGWFFSAKFWNQRRPESARVPEDARSNLKSRRTLLRKTTAKQTRWVLSRSAPHIHLFSDSPGTT